MRPVLVVGFHDVCMQRGHGIGVCLPLAAICTGKGVFPEVCAVVLLEPLLLTCYVRQCCGHTAWLGCASVDQIDL